MQTRIPLAAGVSALVATLIVSTQALAQAIPNGHVNSRWFANASSDVEGDRTDARDLTD